MQGRAREGLRPRLLEESIGFRVSLGTVSGFWEISVIRAAAFSHLHLWSQAFKARRRSVRDLRSPSSDGRLFSSRMPAYPRARMELIQKKKALLKIPASCSGDLSSSDTCRIRSLLRLSTTSRQNFTEMLTYSIKGPAHARVATDSAKACFRSVAISPTREARR